MTAEPEFAAQLPEGPHDPAAALRAAFPDIQLSEHEFRGEMTLIVAAADLPSVAAFLKRSAGMNYNYLSDISAVDYAPMAGEPGFTAFADLAEAARKEVPPSGRRASRCAIICSRCCTRAVCA